MYNLIPDVWWNISSSVNDTTLRQLEKRGLVEIRLDPTISQEQAYSMTLIGQPGQWQVRRTPKWMFKTVKDVEMVNYYPSTAASDSVLYRIMAKLVNPEKSKELLDASITCAVASRLPLAKK